jgi:hypothetical protein
VHGQLLDSDVITPRRHRHNVNTSRLIEVIGRGHRHSTCRLTTPSAAAAAAAAEARSGTAAKEDTASHYNAFYPTQYPSY